MNLWIIAASVGLLLVGAGAVYFLVQYVGARMVADEFKAHGWLPADWPDSEKKRQPRKEQNP